MPGRPSSFKPEYCDQALKLTRLGATDKDLAGFFGVSVSAINRWKLQYPEFRESLKEGKQVADAEVAESLYRRALGYSHDAVKIFLDKNSKPIIVPYTEHYPPDTVACIFWLKNRRPELWRDRPSEEDTTPLPTGVQLKIVSVHGQTIDPEGEHDSPTIEQFEKNDYRE
jgi:transcriptional regulator with XRE-family HTH domain